MTKNIPYYSKNEDSNVVRIFVIRHGQTDHNVKKILQGHRDISLNSRGFEQAVNLGKYLKQRYIKFDKVVSSDLLRCTETIGEVLAYSGQEDIQIGYSKDLRERYMGIIEGMHITEAEAYADKHGKGSFRDFGEPAEEFLHRLTNQIEKSTLEASKEGDKNMALVSHGGSIRTILSWLNYDAKNAHNIIVFNSSVTIIDYMKDTKKFEVRDVGNTRHLGSGEFIVSDLRLR